MQEKNKGPTEEQKEYKTKIWPKYYLPHKKREKSEGLDKVGAELKLKVGGIIDKKDYKEDRGPEYISGPANDLDDIFIIASFSDWMPVKLKTKRELMFEKINPDEPIPKAVFVLDNKMLLHSDFVTPGKHYFYFVKDETQIVLSPNYEVIRFKTTNVFLNSITVKPNMIEYDQIHAVKGQDEEEPVFLKDKSVFRDFRDDSINFLNQCFKQDIAYSKIVRAVKGNDEEFKEVTALLQTQFKRLNNIYLYYQGLDDYPVIG